MSRIFMLLAVFALTACSTSPPPSYYLLSAEATRMSVDWSGSIGIARVTVAEYLQRSEMVTLTAGNQLDIDEYRRWAEPLDSAVTRVLTLNIAALTGSDQVMHMPWSRASAPRWVIHVELQGLNVQRDQIELVASWRIEDSVGASVRASRITTLTRTRDNSSARSIASDTSQLLLELSDQIVGSLSTLAADDEPS